MKRFGALLCLIIISLVITSCGNNGSSSDKKQESVSVTISPSTADLVGGGIQKFTATVHGSSNNGVTWSLSSSGCSGVACGTIEPSGSYTAPDPVPADMTVNVVATAAADGTKSATATAHLTPISIAVSPATASVYKMDMVKFTATVTGALDPTVMWDVEGLAGGDSSTGYIWPSGMYTTAGCDISNAPRTFTITAKSKSDSTKSATAQVTVTGNAPGNSRLSGNYALLFRGSDNDGRIALAGHINADGAGSITGGVLALNSVSSTTVMSGSGSYSVESDGRGTMSLGPWTFRLAVNSAGDIRIVDLDETLTNPIRGSGEIKKQDTRAFSLNAFSGDFAVGLDGDLNASEMALIGTLSWDSTGVLTRGAVDYIPTPTNPVTYATVGSVTSPDAGTGHGTVQLIPSGIPLITPLNFEYFIVSSTEAFLVQSTMRSANTPALSGVLLKQSGGPFSNLSLNGPSILNLTGAAPEGSHTLLGRAMFDGAGNVTGVADENFEGSLASQNSFTARYAVCNNNSCGTIENVVFNSGTSGFFSFYLISPGKAFVAGGTKLSNKVMTGTLEPQTGGPFTLTSAAGTYAVGSVAPAVPADPDISAAVTLDSSGHITGMKDAWGESGPYVDELIEGTLTLIDPATGRGTMTDCSTCAPDPLYFVSPTKLLEMESSTGHNARIQVYER